VTFNGFTIDQVSAVAVQPSGRIIVAGYAAEDEIILGVIKEKINFNAAVAIGLTQTGTLDTSFGGSSAMAR